MGIGAQPQGSPTFTPFLGKGGRGIGIINQKFISKTDFFTKLNLYIYNNRKSYTIQPFCVYCTNYYFKSRE